jgi:hypothetical protein
MSSDFRDASARHLEDAKLLETQSRLANADHLYGVSAECSLKCIMLGLGHPPDAVGAPTGHRDHINVLLANFQVWASGLLDASHLAMLPNSAAFAQWNVNQRYWSRSNGRFVAGTVAGTASAADQCRKVVNDMILDGIL